MRPKNSRAPFSHSGSLNFRIFSKLSTHKSANELCEARILRNYLLVGVTPKIYDMTIFSETNKKPIANVHGQENLVPAYATVRGQTGERVGGKRLFGRILMLIVSRYENSM